VNTSGRRKATRIASIPIRPQHKLTERRAPVACIARARTYADGRRLPMETNMRTALVALTLILVLGGCVYDPGGGYGNRGRGYGYGGGEHNNYEQGQQQHGHDGGWAR
jgi:hypothetical protein